MTENKYSSDVWTLEDNLGIAAAGDRVAKIALEVDTPFTLGISGKWGAGKTSVLRRAFVTLGGQPLKQTLPLGENRGEDKTNETIWQKYVLLDPNMEEKTEYKKLAEQRIKELNWDEGIRQIAEYSLCIWYSPWQHQNTDNPLIPLLLEIKNQFRAYASVFDNLGDWNKRGGVAVVAFLERLSASASKMLGMPNFIKDARETMEATKQAWQGEEANLMQLSDGQRFHILFEEALETLLQTYQAFVEEKKRQFDGQKATQKEPDNTVDSRLIIFIDDLDRCEEKIVVRLLESIKLYLHSRRCVFVLGIDDVAVLKAVSQHWQHRSEDDNREYLEKLFQAIVTVPVPTTVKITALIQKQLQANSLFDMPFQMPSDKKDEVKEETISNMINNLLEPNPRKVKNFMNSLCATWQVLEGRQEELIQYPQVPSSKDMIPYEQPILFPVFFVLMHYLRLYHRAVWRLLERQPWALQVLHTVLRDDESTPQPIGKPSFVSDIEQIALKELFSRAFVHVLKKLSADEKDTYRNMKLEDAVQHFNDRIDRKRSDEHFQNYFVKTVAADLWLPPTLLHLPEPLPVPEPLPDNANTGTSV